jgi:hypothetical protein
MVKISPPVLMLRDQSQRIDPAVTNSSVVVPAGSPQAENGFLETSSQGQRVLDGPETLVRFGLAKRTELRFTVPDYFHNLTTSDGVGSGFGDVAIGVKQQLGPAQGFDVSVILFLCLPTGGNTVSSGVYDPGLQVPWSRGLSANWTAAGMFSVYWPTQARTPKRDWRVYVSARSAIDETLGCVCRVRGRLSGNRSAATLATF